MNISKSIQACLDEAGIQKKTLAKRLGVTKQTVSALMKGETCSPRMLVLLSEVFELKVSEFVELGEG